MSVIMTYLLHFLCLCNYENRLRFGIAKSETRFPFVSLSLHKMQGCVLV